MYQPSENVDGVHGEPYLAVLPGIERLPFHISEI